MAKEKKKSASKLFIILLFLVLISGATGIALNYFGFLKKDVPEQELDNIGTRVEVISFTKKMMPDTYTALKNLDTETGVINKELGRLDDMAKAYPDQTKIISSEKKIWEKTQKELTTALSKLEKEAEAIYVSYMVNPEKGMKRIEDKKTSDLLVEVNKVITASRKQTARLKVVKEKTLIEKIKNKLFSSSLHMGSKFGDEYTLFSFS